MDKVSHYYICAVEGQRLAVATCLECGAALILDGSEKLHLAWHERSRYDLHKKETA